MVAAALVTARPGAGDFDQWQNDLATTESVLRPLLLPKHRLGMELLPALMYIMPQTTTRRLESNLVCLQRPPSQQRSSACRTRIQSRMRTPPSRIGPLREHPRSPQALFRSLWDPTTGPPSPSSTWASRSALC